MLNLDELKTLPLLFKDFNGHKVRQQLISYQQCVCVTDNECDAISYFAAFQLSDFYGFGEEICEIQKFEIGKNSNLEAPQNTLFIFFLPKPDSLNNVVFPRNSLVFCFFESQIFEAEFSVLFFDITNFCRNKNNYYKDFVFFLASSFVIGKLVFTSDVFDLLVEAFFDLQPLLATNVSNSDILEYQKCIEEVSRVILIGRGLEAVSGLFIAELLNSHTNIVAEGLFGGELKHGPLALVDNTLPVIVFCANNNSLLYPKMSNSTQQVVTREGRTLVFFNEKTRDMQQICWKNVEIPVHPLWLTVLLQISALFPLFEKFL
eukprot:TRINITY_DN2628_c1_g1_i1.p1 TRINITY_DN2628_c1_g1~~TRINITY_DN2628_c1_g1_i1.p1  ORF type:complete len:318 (+),score=98.95 TRINITY_DN2628_c1_g1_i1:53-1006(+)